MCHLVPHAFFFFVAVVLLLLLRVSFWCGAGGTDCRRLPLYSGDEEIAEGPRGSCDAFQGCFSESLPASASGILRSDVCDRIA